MSYVTNYPTFTYPEPKERRIGIKVKWYYYDNEADAKTAAEVARKQADYQASRGYDFGYQSPGSIRRHQDWYPGLIEVTLP